MDKEKEVELPSREELVALAQEVNAVLNLEVAIKYGKKVTDEELAAAIVKECKNNVYEIDFTEDAEDATIPFYTEDAEETFKALGIEVLPGSPSDSEAEVAVEEVAVEELVEEEVEVPEPKATGKKGGKKEEAPAKEETKKKDTKKEDAPAKKKEVKEETYSRADALVEVLKSKAKKAAMTSKDIIEAVDALYVKNGGNEGIAMAFNVVKYTLPVMAKLGHIEKEGSKYKYVG